MNHHSNQKVRKGEELPEIPLKKYLKEINLIESIESELFVEQFTHGFSNLTYLLKIENTDIKASKYGMIEVNDFCQTNVEGVFAMGDCNGKGAFTHTAVNDFQIVESYISGKQERKISDRITTYGLFVDPPLGRCGLTKKQAIDQGIKVLEAKIPMKRIARALEKGETHGFISILVNKDTDRIIGAAVLGTGGDEIITSILNVMYADKPYTLIRDSMVAHPTISELIPFTLEKLKPLN